MTSQDTVKTLTYKQQLKKTSVRSDQYGGEIKYLYFSQVKKCLSNVDFVQGKMLGAAGGTQGETQTGLPRPALRSAGESPDQHPFHRFTPSILSSNVTFCG